MDEDDRRALADDVGANHAISAQLEGASRAEVG
jgi:hypothetical protein